MGRTQRARRLLGPLKTKAPTKIEHSPIMIWVSWEATIAKTVERETGFCREHCEADDQKAHACSLTSEFSDALPLVCGDCVIQAQQQIAQEINVVDEILHLDPFFIV